MWPTDPIAEGSRIMTICNACRYCEGFCPVFPAMELRLQFREPDINYLANLCHNCGECYYACPYAGPHEFAVNVPRTLARIRTRSYRKYAWPRMLAKAFDKNSAVLAWMLAWTVGLSIVVASGAGRLLAPPGATFYDVIPHRLLASLFGIAGLAALGALATGFAACWRESGMGAAPLESPVVLWRAAKDALSLCHLDHADNGCTSAGELRTDARRRFHHCTLYGFLLCFASTTVAAIYHYGGRAAPYDYLSLPVVLGTLGGFGLLAGPAGLYLLRRVRDPATRDPGQEGLDVTFLLMLFLTSLTGLLLLIFRETAAMAMLLVLHLAIVLALFVALPYGKFVHGLYRYAALVRFALENGKGTTTKK